ncbi:PREDICTED: 3'-5' exoribonuclease 1-like [Amphimedon queenslandica]|uniref:Exonuclease domain-containing protein n=1 Tax=Amphimedon queenslandica TaxID=400682 RepID=A0A1X7VR54_AMPQE|nr:PREDICTED: 3'-5' exoribonuclease 1-like [Amphimedon queenslandica]|eukprot:XP_003383307.1 PREDICTED: 3'-5' exoribonuclease 1-like [Amphimedon queenslandica]
MAESSGGTAEKTDANSAADNSRKHPLYKTLSRFNRELNKLKPEEIRDRLRRENLSDQGTDPIIYKRYKQYQKKNLVSLDPSPPYELWQVLSTNPLGLKFLLVLDFEATCESVNSSDYIHEIIEFPVQLLDISTLKIVDTFHSYCRPCLNEKLSSFCTKLTGIEQSIVDKAPTFAEVFDDFTEWMEERELGTKHNFSLVTDCPWDIRECLFPQCALSKVSFPHYASKWIDARKLFSSFYQISSGNLANMLTQLGMSFEGREHSGLDDSKNIARIVSQLISDGCTLQYNRFISQDIISSIFKN